MTGNDIFSAMRRLPRATASPRFTSDVIHAVDAPRPTHAWRFAAAMTCLIAIGGGYLFSLRARERRLESFRAERERIESDLQRVKALADESEPVVVLENGDTRLIVNRENPKQSPQLFYY